MSLIREFLYLLFHLVTAPKCQCSHAGRSGSSYKCHPTIPRWVSVAKCRLKRGHIHMTQAEVYFYNCYVLLLISCCIKNLSCITGTFIEEMCVCVCCGLILFSVSFSTGESRMDSTWIRNTYNPLPGIERESVATSKAMLNPRGRLVGNVEWEGESSHSSYSISQLCLWGSS